jgi:hypothetical protein
MQEAIITAIPVGPLITMTAKDMPSTLLQAGNDFGAQLLALLLRLKSSQHVCNPGSSVSSAGGSTHLMKLGMLG